MFSVAAITIEEPNGDAHTGCFCDGDAVSAAAEPGAQ